MISLVFTLGDEFMKKMVLLCAAVLACGGLAGCGQHKDSSSAKISSLKAENSSLKAKKSSSHKAKHHRQSSSRDKNSNTATGNSANSHVATGNQQASGTQQSKANSIVRDKDGRIVYPDGTRGPIPSPYKEGTPEYDQWHASVAESIRSAYNEPNLQLGPEPRANNGQ